MNSIFELKQEEIVLVAGARKNKSPKSVVIMPGLFQDIWNNIRNNMGFGSFIVLGIIALGMKLDAIRSVNVTHDGSEISKQNGWKNTIMSFSSSAFQAFSLSLIVYVAKKFA
jgi:anionic cell wall polymer biosynthesis LytR-Cps2A-Psr (LCP) family protein